MSNGRRRANNRRIIAALAERYPQTFFVSGADRKPLKIRIYVDLLAALPIAEFPTRDLKFALASYVAHDRYLRACTVGAPRFDLDGNESGKVSVQAAAYAALRLADARKAEDKPNVVPLPAPRPKPARLSFTDLRTSALARKRVIHV